MPVQKEGAHQHEDQEHLALVFAQAVRDVCFTSTDMRLNAIGEIIGEYVRENPHNDVLNRTRDLFFMTRSLTHIEGFVLDASEWREAIQEIKHRTSLSPLKDQVVLQRHHGDFEVFLERVEKYGLLKLEENHVEMLEQS